MKAIAKLKDDARKHEQKEEWEKAIQAYLQVLKIGEQGDGAELDLPLYNRVGDLYVRLGKPADAVTYYEQAADRYAEAGLYNNAIALCNKALRYDANRVSLLKKLGSFSASQGFYTDARRWYLEYAEKSIRSGHVDDAFNALAEYTNVNDDVEIREILARQLRDHGRSQEAIDQFKRAYALRVAAGQQDQAEGIRSEITAIDPNADVTSGGAPAGHHHTAHEDELTELPGFSDAVPTATIDAPQTADAADLGAALEIEQTAIAGGLELDGDMGDFGNLNIESGFGGGADAADVETLDIGLEQPLGVVPDLPQIDTADEEADTFELPTFDDPETTAADAMDEAALSLPTFDDFTDHETAEGAEETVAELTELPGFDGEPEDAAPLPGFDDFALPTADDEARPDEDFEDIHVDLPGFDETEIEAETEAATEAEKEAETATGPVSTPAAAAPAPPAPPPPPQPAPPPPPPPPAPKKEKEYVDLASFLNDDEDEAEDSTRFVVAEKPPTGDEEQDFADMLAQFKQKVAEQIPTEDSGSHYDLGIAFKEMGLIDEAIGEFQTALRAGQEKLKVYEELGSCFVQKQQYSVAITVLKRAQTLPYNDESELLGVYYNLGRAYEELGQHEEAKSAYEKIISIDIGFQDTTERLSRL